VAGILSARSGSPAPGICPNCTLLVRPIFAETASANGDAPSAKPEELADAIVDGIRAGAQVLNISAAIAQPLSKSERALDEALDQAGSVNFPIAVAFFRDYQVENAVQFLTGARHLCPCRKGA